MQIYNSYFSAHSFKIKERHVMGKTCSSYEGGKSEYKLVGRKHHGKRPSGRFRKKQDNIKLYLKEMGHADFNGPGQDLIAGTTDLQASQQ